MELMEFSFKIRCCSAAVAFLLHSCLFLRSRVSSMLFSSIRRLRSISVASMTYWDQLACSNLAKRSWSMEKTSRRTKGGVVVVGAVVVGVGSWVCTTFVVVAAVLLVGSFSGTAGLGGAVDTMVAVVAVVAVVAMSASVTVVAMVNGLGHESWGCKSVVVKSSSSSLLPLWRRFSGAT